MKKDKESALKTASGNQIAQMAYDAAMWYKAVFLQAVRFAECKHEDPFRLPWREHREMPVVAEKLFLILAIDHALNNIRDLNIALQSRNDSRLKDIKEELLDRDGFYDKIRQLRNANEHKTEYQLGIGNAQDSFVSTISTKCGAAKINSHCFFQIGDEAFVGGVNLMDMLKHMKNYRDKIIPLLETIKCEYYGGKDNGQTEI